MRTQQILLGVFAVIAIDVMLALLWVPLCSVSGPDGSLAGVGVVMFVAAIWLGLTQWVLVGPFLLWAHLSGRAALARGGLITALVITGLWCIGFVIVMLS
ncbi:MAG: hypothetical protein KDI48_07380 [Xanthomonadales bacterium]|nr:hypothetical protein [Xanthomonadales bacterium]